MSESNITLPTRSEAEARKTLMRWQPIETLVRDGRQVMFHSPLGGHFIAPASEPHTLTTKQMVAIYRNDGSWQNVGHNATHWMPLPAPPTSEQMPDGEGRPIL